MFFSHCLRFVKNPDLSTAGCEWDRSSGSNVDAAAAEPRGRGGRAELPRAAWRGWGPLAP